MEIRKGHHFSYQNKSCNEEKNNSSKTWILYIQTTTDKTELTG